MNRADPYITKAQDGTYYFTASVPEYDGIRLRWAATLAALVEAGETEVWHRHEAGPMSFNIWAPELHRMMDGHYYIYFAGGDKDEIFKIRPYVLKCESDDPMAGPWTECGMMQAADDDPFSFRAFSLDATVFENKGAWYYVWAEKVGVGKQISNLYIARMESPTKLATVQVLLTTPDYSWERGEFWVDEGPAVIRHGNRLWLTFSASDTGPSYCVGLMSAEVESDLLDPLSWTKEREPFFASAPAFGLYGPGHNSFTKDGDGQDIMVFHARPTEKIVTDDPLYDDSRSTYLAPLSWDADGRPALELS